MNKTYRRGLIAMACGAIAIILLLLVTFVEDYDIYRPRYSGNMGNQSGILLDDSTNFYKDERIKAIWKDKYGAEFDLEIARLSDIIANEVPTNSTVVSFNGLFEDNIWRVSKDYYRSAVLGVSPLVIYTWDNLVPALEKEGLVQSLDNKVNYFNIKKYLDNSGKYLTWESLGVEASKKYVHIESTHPVHNSSGFSYATLLMSALVQGDELKENDIKWVQDDLLIELSESLFSEMSSAQLFNAFLEQKLPMVILPENMLIEYMVKHTGEWDSTLSKVRVLYPSPNVMLQIKFFALDKKVEGSFDAIYDYDVSNRLWDTYGIRPYTNKMENMHQRLERVGIAPEVFHTVDIYGYKVLESLYNTLKEGDLSK